MKRVRLTRRATHEARAASQWYSVRDPRVADAFEAALDEAIDRIAAVPGVGSPWPGEPSVQRVVLRGFPYSVVFHDTGTELIVLAVAHQKRKPGYWRR